jgi:hypothetical protein
MPQLPPPDPAVPALRVLLGDEAGDVLNAAVAEAGLTVDEASVSQVRYSPERSVTVQYRTQLTDADGATSRPMLVATSGLKVPEGPAVVADSAMSIAVWRFPRDPFLPGLTPALNAASARDLLERLGAPTRSVKLRTRAYRATRRAVIEATGDSETVYMKVLRPSRVGGLQQRHAALAPHLPIPHSLGWSRELGIVAMQALGGRTLRQTIEAGELELPSPQALVALLDQFPDPDPKAPAVNGAYQRAPEHARLIGAILPEANSKLEAIVSAVTIATSPEPSIAVHGDFHSSQVLVAGGRIVGLVDVDTAGIGQRLDDLANLIGQLSTLTLVSQQPGAIAAYIGELMGGFDEHADPVALRLRTAAVVLGLATGPFRVQLANWPADTMRRLDLALRWIAAADRKEIPTNP